MIKQRALTATLWSGADVVLRQALQFSVTIALARLLTPSDFGAIALLALFIGVAKILLDGGFSAALIQRQDVSHADESTVFWFNLVIGAGATIALGVAAPAIATFYQIPALRPLTYLMALTVLVSALGSIHSTLLSKRLDFRTQMVIGALASAASGGVAVVAAWKGYGVWALALQNLTMTCVTTGLLWLLNPWRPSLQFSRASARRLFGFGGYHLASILLEMVYSRLYTLLIGKFYSTRELGFYSNADTTRQVPGNLLTGVLGRVAFPMLAAVAVDKRKVRRAMQLALRGLMLLNVPIMLGFAAVSEPLVLSLFGVQWLPAVPILRVLCLSGVFFPLHALNLQALMAQGHSRLMFRIEVTKKLLGVMLISAGAFYGVMGIAWSQVIFSTIALAINTHYSRRLIAYGLVAQLRDSLPTILIAAPMAAIVYISSLYLQLNPLLKLLLLSGEGALLFFSLARIFRLAALNDIASMFRQARCVVPHSETQD